MDADLIEDCKPALDQIAAELEHEGIAVECRPLAGTT
jgi:hypothetical protein